MKTADDATIQEVLAATILSAYYDGRIDSALHRVGKLTNGLVNPPDDDRLVKLLWGEPGEPLSGYEQKMLARAMVIAKSLLTFLEQLKAET